MLESIVLEKVFMWFLLVIIPLMLTWKSRTFWSEKSERFFALTVATAFFVMFTIMGWQAIVMGIASIRIIGQDITVGAMTLLGVSMLLVVSYQIISFFILPVYKEAYAEVKAKKGVINV